MLELIERMHRASSLSSSSSSSSMIEVDLLLPSSRYGHPS